MIFQLWNSDGRFRDLEDVLRAAAFDRDSGGKIQDCLKRLVKRPNYGQAAKGILSAGAYKTVVYSGAKLTKMFASYQKRVTNNLLHGEMKP